MTDDILKNKTDITIAQLEAKGKVTRLSPDIFNNEELDEMLFDLRCVQANNVRSVSKDNSVIGPNGHLKR